MPDNNGNSPRANLIGSVTARDYATSPDQYGGGVLQFLVPGIISGDDLPPYWSPSRDAVLTITPMREAMWAAAVHIAITKVATHDWRLRGTRLGYWQDLLKAADDNATFTSFLEKLTKDFLLTDNGCFYEIHRVNNARGARIQAIRPLSSLRCIRTGDPNRPVRYRDAMGRWHDMKDYEVVSLVDEPTAGFSGGIKLGIGFCAASRAHRTILKMAALETYVYEKVSGKKPLDIALVNANIREKQLQSAIDTQKEQQLSQGYTQYMGVVIVPILDPTSTPAVAHIPIAGLPDGFDPEKERREGKLTYADAIGLDPLELDPELATRGKSLGTGAQAQVLDDKQSGRGLVAFITKFSTLLNENVLPERVQFSMYEDDLVDQGRKAAILKTHADAMRALVGNGQEPPIITPEQAKNIMVDQGELGQEYLVEDLTPNQTISAQDKPALALNAPRQEPPDAALMQTEPPEVPVVQGVKP